MDEDEVMISSDDGSTSSAYSELNITRAVVERTEDGVDYLVNWCDPTKLEPNEAKLLYIRLMKGIKKRNKKQVRTRCVNQDRRSESMGIPEPSTSANATHQLPSTSYATPPAPPRPLSNNPSANPPRHYRPPTHSDMSRSHPDRRTITHSNGPRCCRHFLGPRICRPFARPSSHPIVRIPNHHDRFPIYVPTAHLVGPRMIRPCTSASQPQMGRQCFDPNIVSAHPGNSTLSMGNTALPVSYADAPSSSQSFLHENSSISPLSPEHHGPIIRVKTANMSDFITIYPPPGPNIQVTIRANLVSPPVDQELPDESASAHPRASPGTRPTSPTPDRASSSPTRMSPDSVPGIHHTSSPASPADSVTSAHPGFSYQGDVVIIDDEDDDETQVENKNETHVENKDDNHVENKDDNVIEIAADSEDDDIIEIKV